MARVLDVTGWQRRPWDSEFFGLSIAQVASAPNIAGDLGRIVAEADDAAVDCLYWLIDAADRPGVRAAEENGFSLVDVRLTLECEIREAGGPPYGPTSATIRAATANDLPALTALARISHRNTRFHTDGRFDRTRSDELYAVWIEKSVTGERAAIVWTVDVDGAPRGYLTASRDADRATIGLVAVHPDYRGRGYGEALLRTVLHWAAEQALPRVSVVTQGQSAAAVRFYERAGFTTSGVQFWYHRWRERMPA